jgi:hypothetical protein
MEGRVDHPAQGTRAEQYRIAPDRDPSIYGDHASSPFFKLGKHEAVVFWDPRTAGKTVPRDLADPAREIAARRSTGPMVVASGLEVSPALPVTNEIVVVSLAIDTKIDLTREEAFAKTPEQLSAEVWTLDGASKEWVYKTSVELGRRGADSDEPTVARYRGEDLRFDSPGYQKIKLSYAGDRPVGESTSKPPPPREWGDHRNLEVFVRVAIEGEGDAPSLEDDSPVKVFTDGQPFWWLWGEPGFADPYKNERPPTGSQTNTNQATSFRVAPGQNFQSLKLRFQGLFFDSSSNDQPVDALRRYRGLPTSPNLRVFAWEGVSGHPHPSFDSGADRLAARLGCSCSFG